MYVEEGCFDDEINEGLVDLIELIVEFALIDDVACRDDEHIPTDGIEKAHLEGRGADGLD